MSKEKAVEKIHPKGEPKSGGIKGPETNESVDTFAGKVQVKWMPEAAVSSLGLMPYFIEFLKTSGVFDAWVEDCPLEFKSPNAPQKRDVLGTILLSVLSGHWRYAHISAIRGDGVNPDLLGMKKVASEDSVRRALLSMEEARGDGWMKRHLKASYEPLLEEAWILDMDSTVKPLYGHQDDAKLGYNPIKPARPSHVYHTDFIANLRVVGSGGPGGKSDGHILRTARIVGVVGRSEGEEPTRVLARRLQLGNGARDGRSRAAEDSICIQIEADRKSEEADRADVSARPMGRRRSILARFG